MSGVGGWAARIRPGAEVVLAGFVVAVVGLMVVPLPTIVLDALLAANLCLAVLLLLTAFFVRSPLSFAAFPTVLLLSTLFRLALNVSSTRLILLQADAGAVIDAFGSFVVQGDYIVGAVVFAILTLIQLVVIARGAERVAEVGARFTLDAMPGKQLAIDADLRSGVLDPREAAAQRRQLERESQFYGAMDGAMKFVRGDAIAGLAITAINLVGGLAIGVGTRGMDAGASLQVYGLLTIGDGLVSQLPSLLISTAAGLVVTRVASEEEGGSLGADLGAQLFGDRRALFATAAVAALLGLVPGLPVLPFLLLAAVLALLAAFGRPAARPAPAAGPTGPVDLAVGARAAASLSSAWPDALTTVEAHLRETTGIRVGSVDLRVDASLAPNVYRLRLGGVTVDEDEARSASELAQRLTERLAERPEALLGLQEVQAELDRLAESAPALVRAVVPARIELPRLARLLRDLVREGVPIAPFREVLEAVAAARADLDDEALLAATRVGLSPLLCARLAEDGTLAVHPADPALEDAVRDARGRDGRLAASPTLLADLVEAVDRQIDGGGVVVTQPDVRRLLADALRPARPAVRVMSYDELRAAPRVEHRAPITP